MDLRQIEYVVAVVDHGGFTKAAAACHVAQPSLSQSVRRLEAELGAPLFTRLGRTVELTEVGRDLLGPARRLLRGAESIRGVVAEHVALATGTLDLVALPTLVADPLVPLIGSFRAAHPSVRVRVAEPVTPTELLAAVWDGRCEVGLSEAGPVRDGLVARSLGDQELVAVLPPGAEVGPGPLPLEAFASLPMVLGPPLTSARELVERALGEIGRTPDVAVETGQREALVPLVLTGAGATVLPPALAADAGRQGAVVRSLGPALTRSLALVHRAADLSPAAEAFLAVAPAPARGRVSGGRTGTGSRR